MIEITQLLTFLGVLLVDFSEINLKVISFILFQIDHNAREDFNLTSDVEFNAIRSLVLGRVSGE